MTPIQQMLLGAGAAQKKIYLDDVFSTYLYRGWDSNAWIQNGVGLSDEVSDRMVWIKNRGTSHDHWIFDTERGANSGLKANENDIVTTTNATVFANNNFQTNGFVTGYGDASGGHNNWYTSYTFGTHPGFFDIVTWTGNATANRKISHSLGSVPGAIWIKRLSGSTGTNVSDWVCYHRMSNGGSYPHNFLMFLNRNVTPSNDGAGNYLYNVPPAADEFTIGSHNTVNANGDTYIAYVFAHDDQQFGEGGDQSIIKCGGYTGNASSSDGPIIDLGWDPQWLLIKPLDDTEDWSLFDSMRGLSVGNNDPKFSTHQNNAESDATAINPRHNGFQIDNQNIFVNGNNSKYAYIAIRSPSGLVSTPVTDPTKVFAIDTGNSSNTIPAFDSGFAVDMRIAKNTNSAGDWWVGSRITQGKHLKANSTDSEVDTSWGVFDSNVGSGISWNAHYLGFMWKRHAGFDAVTYKGNASSTALKHGLGQIPEMIWCKNRDNAYTNWIVYHKDLNNGSNPHNSFVYLDNSDTPINNSSRFGAAPTKTQFTVGTDNSTNGNNEEMIAYLFSSVDGISSVGSYTGNGSTTGPTITTGFSPKLIIIRRIDTGDNWNLFDSNRGIDGNMDSLLRMNMDNTPLNVANFVTPSSTGFQVVNTDSAMNVNNGKYIYYAHA